MPLLGQWQQRAEPLLWILELSPAVHTLAILFAEPLVPIDNSPEANLSTGRDARRVVDHVQQHIGGPEHCGWVVVGHSDDHGVGLL